VRTLALALLLVPSIALARGPGCIDAADATPRQVAQYRRDFDAAGRQFRIDPDLGRAITMVESGFDPRAVSSKGAQGLMQLMPATGDAMSVRNPFNGRQNIFGGLGYLRQVANDRRFAGQPYMALVAYNAGPNRKVFPAESYQYADKVVATYWRLRQHGLEPHPPGICLYRPASRPSPTLFLSTARWRRAATISVWRVGAGCGPLSPQASVALPLPLL
jgi:soluble lytic murein transglycosylase-like protein